MNIYTIHQWLIVFYIYCFMGWIWESCYVSLKSHKWVNRGFLKGPFLPIYGTGAIVVLISTLRVQNNILLIFVIGMISATILEYITGALMEKLFHVRYWDYTSQPFNINGYVCLLCSLAWGVFSLLLVKVVNPPIDNLVNNIPSFIVEVSSYITTIFITIDAVQSFNEAMDLKDLLIRFTERNSIIDKLSLRVKGESSKLKDEFAECLSRLKAYESRINNAENRVYISSIKILRRNPNARAKRYEAAMREIKDLDNKDE